MKCSRIGCLMVFMMCSLLPCFAHHMAVVVNKDNAVGEVSSAHLSKIFRLEVKKWHDDKDVILVLHKSSSGEMSTLERLSKMSSSELKSFIAAHQGSITMVDSDEDVLKVVETMPGAVGLVDVRSINDQVNVVRVDGKLPMEDGYLPH
ncbi:MAG TPA: substrate-binding domain-containing protein [Terriglobales bacterium]|nr:substrate-binding domain-containing protein [Terriglobales bacterium]